MLTQTEKALIIEDAKDSRFDPDMIEITDKEFTLKDGRQAHFVNVYAEVTDEYGNIATILDQDESYYVVVVDGAVYGNVELDALRWEYASADEMYDVFDAYLAS